MKGPLRNDHLDDLVASSYGDPHPRKTRRIEWIGEKSPMDDPRVQAKILMGKYTPLQEAAIRLAAAKAVTRVFGARDRLMGHEHQHSIGHVKGLHRSYLFTHLNGYTCDVDYHDVDIIMSSPYAHEFVDLDALGPDEPRIMTFTDEVFQLVSADAAGLADARVGLGHKVAVT